jgi:erythromycin esterase
VPPPVVDGSAPLHWLANHAYPLQTVEPSWVRSDLAPLRTLIGNATIVGLGDGTHGTHEFYTVKLRIIEYLVREMGFDAIAIEGAFPVFEKLNAYAQGESIDPRPILAAANTDLGYFFWDVEEMLALLDWMRDYNLHREAGRPPVEIAGMDIYDQITASNSVVAFLRAVDPAAATVAESDYTCVLARERNEGCVANTRAVLDRLEARIVEYTAVMGMRATQDALQYANVTMQGVDVLAGPERDTYMARNTLWIRDHRGASRRVVLWAHQEHVGRMTDGLVDGPTVGWHLDQAVSDEYFVIGTVGGSGMFGGWIRQNNAMQFITPALPLPEPESYEWYFAQRGVRQMLIPLRGDIPSWLAARRTLRTAGTNAAWQAVERNLAEMVDAVVYVETVTPVRPLAH